MWLMHLCVQYNLTRLTACQTNEIQLSLFWWDPFPQRASKPWSFQLFAQCCQNSFFFNLLLLFFCLSYVCLKFSFFLFCFETIRSFSFIFPLIIFTLRSAFEKHLKCLPTLNPEIVSDSYLCSIDPLFFLG